MHKPIVRLPILSAVAIVLGLLLSPRIEVAAAAVTHKQRSPPIRGRGHYLRLKPPLSSTNGGRRCLIKSSSQA
ncbi:hypothetical protein QN277_008987 [Acacia crassicarpa]|uniref:Secreted protein n=1 Tax=Acacia crassicarpa TaxID=499986 RepID=A0AAE1M8S2_9FABA|nr:hypothetical protein QN277_008987 [Acacia crassicarpa]